LLLFALPELRLGGALVIEPGFLGNGIINSTLRLFGHLINVFGNNVGNACTEVDVDDGHFAHEGFSMNLNVCVICGSSDNLNTSMTIKVDDEDVTVKICDTDAETATPKMVMKSYLGKKSEIEEILAKARALGLQVDLPDSTSKIAIVADNRPKPVPPAAASAAPASPGKLDSAIAASVAGSRDEGVLPTSVVDSVAQRVRGASGGEVNAESYAAYTQGAGQDKLDPTLLEGRVKMGVGEGRGGQVIAVPAVRVDGTGTTTVRVRKDIDDAAIQRRFKQMANPDSGGHSFLDGYNVHNCPICKGEGVAKQRGVLDVCPKCKGTGLLNS